ncbi:MAG: hypothetical protein FJ265_07505 [Planctomycetes bacterium]|nr:hypothetical protein [Planctomycetota bacterium]
MSLRSVSTVALFALFAACHSTPGAPCPDTQKIVEAVAADHPAVTRLTVHATPPGGSGPVAVASTLAEKRGKPSDPEDLDAMKRGEPVVLDVVGEFDVTVPICQKEGKYTAAVGVSFANEKGANKRQLTDLAAAIAKVVEDRMAALKK